jgi:CBS-domain-containing membrane protein
MSKVLSWLGLELTPNNHREKLISGLGGMAGIASVVGVTRLVAGPGAVLPVVASMGASTVLLFAAPHGPLSQPWALMMGHLVSAVVGVAVVQLMGSTWLAAAVAVGVAITAMYYARCVHPPGGATALTFVIGGPAVQALGWGYVLAPVGVNVLILLLVAVGFNYAFKWRRYPAGMGARMATVGKLTREDWAAALGEVGSLADVSEEELVELHALASRHAALRQPKARPALRRRRRRRLQIA